MNKTQVFIEKAQKIWGDRFDYSKTNYTNYKTKVVIICKKHGPWNQTPSQHLNKKGCYQCGRIQSRDKLVRNKQQVIKKFRMVHQNKYDYSKMEYHNAHKKICIICKNHGEFWQTPTHHQDGMGCPHCAWNPPRTQEDILLEFKRKHGNFYDYSKTIYLKKKSKVIIICPIHGQFEQTPDDHIKSGCRRCGYIKTGKAKKLTRDEVINKFKHRHGNFYDYSKFRYEISTEKSIIICPFHGEFKQNSNSHLSGRGCPKCRPPQSKTARKWLNLIKTIAPNLITWESPGGEYRIPGTRWHADGYDPDTNTIYEYHGWYWHGCPMMYPREKMNNVCGKTMGELYDATKAREKKIKEMGYNLCAIWGE